MPGDLTRVSLKKMRGESAIDWLVRLGLAPSPAVAAEMLILAAGLQTLLDELCQLPADEFPSDSWRAGGAQISPGGGEFALLRTKQN